MNGCFLMVETRRVGIPEALCAYLGRHRNVICTPTKVS